MPSRGYDPSMDRTYPVVLVPQEEGGYFVQCPVLPGCYSQGETVEESLANIAEAISLVLEDMQANNEPVPSSDAVFANVRIPA